ncbi:MAG: nucleotide exchange factor GrpE [Desulfarculus sp.]|nr:nucleotide exchange factor GrpE [Desulfarculus sp.]
MAPGRPWPFEFSIDEEPLDLGLAEDAAAGGPWEEALQEVGELKHEVDRQVDLLRHTRQTDELARRRLIKEIIEDLLDPLDHLLGTLNPSELSGPAKNWHKRLQRVQKRIEDLLARHHCEALDLTSPPMGSVTVASEEPRDDLPNGHILEVLQRGFMLDGALFRPAQVSVVRNPGHGQ